MSVRNHAYFWAVVIALTIGFILLFQDILLPFILGLVIGYLLDPTTDKLEAMKIPRGISAFLVLTGFFVVLLLIISLILPVLEVQVVRLADVLPDYLQQAKDELIKLSEVYVEPYLGADLFNREELGRNYGEKAAKWVSATLQGVWSGGQAVFGIISLLIITPVVAFYLLRDWDKMVAMIDSYLPRKNRDTVRKIMHDIDETLAGFLRGQGIVCLLLGIFYAAGLSLAGLDFGLLLGLFIGLISFIPYIGAIFGGILCIGLALLQFSTMGPVLMVAGIFAVGQFLEGNILAPKFVGDNVNLHPVWILFALLAGGSLFGFTGVLIAVPVAAVLGVMTRYVLGEYKKSALYKGAPQKRLKKKKS